MKLVFLHVVELTTKSLVVLKDKYLIYKLKSSGVIFRRSSSICKILSILSQAPWVEVPLDK